MSLLLSIESIAEECVNCGICGKECSFLQQYGSPLNLALAWRAEDTRKENAVFPFECSLCGLCHAVCPKDLDPSSMFLAMRRQVVQKGAGLFAQHRSIRAYEKRGSSALFSWFSFPPNCHTILFPGCSLPGSRPRTLSRLFQLLQETIPDVGIVLDCCTKPSHDLGDTEHFKKMFGELSAILKRYLIKKVLVACPNCYRIFQEYGEGIEVQTVYEHLSFTKHFDRHLDKELTVHDPCGVRFSSEVQQSVRDLLSQQGVSVNEMEHTRMLSFCCGEGGSAGFMRPDLAKTWTRKRVEEAGEKEIASYCAGCTHFLGGSVPTYHVLDLCFFPQAVLSGRQKVSKAPFTYWNRFCFKRRLKKEMEKGVFGSREQLLS